MEILDRISHMKIAQRTQRMQYMSVWVYQYMSSSIADF